MIKVIEKYYCDICGRESNFKLTGSIDVENGEDFPCNKYIHKKEVCVECCNKVIQTIHKLKEVKE